MRFQKGKYYVGDPCYLFDESWLGILNSNCYFDDSDTFHLINGEKCFVISTAYGDGTYYDDFSRSYSVDAGLIGILPVSLRSLDNTISEEKFVSCKHYQIITFDHDFEVTFIKRGVIQIDDFIINTADEEEYTDDGDFYGDDEMDEEEE